MINIFEYLDKDVSVTCKNGKVFTGNVIGMDSSLEEGTDNPEYDSITVYDGDIATQLFRHEIADIEELEE